MLRCLCFLLFLGPLSYTLHAQWCSSPGLSVRFADESAAGRDVLQIKVVVHIVYRSENTNISDEQVYSQIEVLNQDFRKANSDIDQVTLVEFQQLTADTEIEFVLATSDPEGNPSSGILRQQSDIENIASTFDEFGRRQIAYTELGGSDAWSTDCYLNIWVGEFVTGVAGLGTFPGSVDELEDGVYIATDRFGTLGTATAPYDKGRTATHEVGHFLGLQHLWGNDAVPPSDCSGDDGIADTKKQSVSYLNECPAGNRFTCGSFDMYMNFMSLAQDACLLMFTSGQKTRMRNILLQDRSGLVDPSTSECIVDVEDQNPSAPSLLTDYYLETEYLTGHLSGSNVVELSLFDLNGHRLIILPNQQHSFRIDMQYLPQGIYILQARQHAVQQSVKVFLFK